MADCVAVSILIGLWLQHRPLESGECHVSTSVLQRVGATPGDTISLLPDFDELFSTVGGRELWSSIKQAGRLTVEQAACIDAVAPWLTESSYPQSPDIPDDLRNWVAEHLVQLAECSPEPAPTLMLLGAQQVSTGTAAFTLIIVSTLSACPLTLSRMRLTFGRPNSKVTSLSFVFMYAQFRALWLSVAECGCVWLCVSECD